MAGGRRVAVAALVLSSCASSHAPRTVPLQVVDDTTTTNSTTTTSSSVATTTTVTPSSTTAAPVHRNRVRRAARSRPPAAEPQTPTPPTETAAGGRQTALASWYARGARTANGERFDAGGLTFAHRTMGFGTVVRFCRAGRCVTARCTDRGPAVWTGRTFDLSRGAFSAIAPLGAGVVTVTWEAA